MSTLATINPLVLLSPAAEQAREYARRARSESTLRSYKTDCISAADKLDQ